ncbi:MAG: NAD-dependent epimerase/dehydratase family protein [Trueperaceae bacterium]
MKILVLGGTQFIGKQFVMGALARGHEITLFNRGSKPAPAGVETVTGDRNTDLNRLAAGRWDAVVDTSAYVPRQVREAARLLEPNVGRYLFISTVSVYADTSKPYINEGAPLARLDDPAAEEVTGATYGGLKVLCEEELAAAFPAERSLVLRPTIVVGSDDPTDRFTYWPVRVANGGQVLAPHGPNLPLQWIDVRDLADFMLQGLEAGLSGTFNAASGADVFDMGSLLSASAQVTSSDAEVVWVEDDFLLEQNVRPFADLPFWLPAPASNMFRVDASRAQAAGLTIRAVDDTVRATLEWHTARGQPNLKIGIGPDRETAVLRAWARHLAGGA